MSDPDAALADLADAVGRALIRYAQAIRPNEADSAVTPGAEAEEGPRGPLQRAVLVLEGINGDPGLSASEIAEGVGATQPNTYKLVDRMIAGGWLEQVPGVEPRRWRTSRETGRA